MTQIRQTTAISDKPAQSAKNPAVSDKPPSPADELLQLIDDFAELSEVGAFMCHAFATSLSDHKLLNKPSSITNHNHPLMYSPPSN